MSTIPDRLARLGKELLGHGDAALVWGEPAAPFVVKVGFDGDDAWPAWAAWCRAHPGPHVPIVHACEVSAHQGRREAFVGIVERLLPTDAFRRLLLDDRRLKRDPLRLATVIAAAHPSVAAMLRRAAASFPEAMWDMAPSNWMARSCGTLVLMDPLSRV